MRRRLFVALTTMAAVAFGGEVFLGTTEYAITPGSSNFYSDGGGFKVPINQKLSVWCTATGFLSVGRDIHVFSDGGVGDAGAGLPYDTARAIFPTSSAGQRINRRLFSATDAGDGGLIDAGYIEWAPNGGSIVISSSTSAGVCHWYLRDGTE